MIFAIKPFEIHDGDGIRTTVFFKGCPLRCRWCHNPESFFAAPQLAFHEEKCTACGRCAALCDVHRIADGRHTVDRARCVACGKCAAACPNEALTIYGYDLTPDELAKRLLKDELFMKASGGGVTLSGGEPLLQADYCRALCEILHAHDIPVAIDTCGEVPRAALDKVIGLADAFLFDVKAVDEQTHIRCTGVSNRRILENLRYLNDQNQNIEVRYPYVPGMNDGEADAIARLVAALPAVKRLRVLGYHDLATGKYASLGMSYPLPDTPVPDKAAIAAVIARMKALGAPAMSSDD